MIAIRGSMSLRDAITDLSMNDESLSTLPLGSDAGYVALVSDQLYA